MVAMQATWVAFEMPRARVAGRARVVGAVTALLVAAGLWVSQGAEAWHWAWQAWTAPPAMCRSERVAHDFQLDQCKKFSERRQALALWALVPWVAGGLVAWAWMQSAAAAYAAAQTGQPGAVVRVVRTATQPPGMALKWRAWWLCLRWVGLEGGRFGWQPQTEPTLREGQMAQTVVVAQRAVPWVRLHAPQMMVIRGRG